MGFIVGTSPDVTFPVGFFTGNRLFGAEVRVLVSLVEVVTARATSAGAHFEVCTDAPSLGSVKLAVCVLRGGGVRLTLRAPEGLHPMSTLFTLISPAGEGLYGLGGRKDVFNQRGLLRNVWVSQQNTTTEAAEAVTSLDPTGLTGEDYTFPNGAQAAYYVTTALHGHRGWAAWARRSSLSRMDLARSRGDALRWGVKSSKLILSLAGGGMEQAARSYTAEAGRAPAPPRYVFEPWIDVINEGEGEAAPNGQGFTGGSRVRCDVETIVRHAHEDELPIGVIGVEGWQAVDYGHPGARPYWSEQVGRSCELGFEAFMHDFGEFVTEGMRFHNGNPPEVEHNAYPVRYHRAARAAVEKYRTAHPGFEPFFYVRSGYSPIESGEGVAGSTSGVFPGDETTDWTQGSGLPSVVPAMLNLAMGGSFTFTTDVGGYLDLFAPRTSAELFTRWTQLAAFTAVSRIHNSTYHGEAYPWSFDRDTLDIYRRYAKAKVRLIPLVEHWSRRAARDGEIGPVRPLPLDDPSAAAANVDDQWLLGHDILAARVLERGATERSVYLPSGARWQRVMVDDA